jgi:hypothetical protein
MPYLRGSDQIRAEKNCDKKGHDKVVVFEALFFRRACHFIEIFPLARFEKGWLLTDKAADYRNVVVAVATRDGLQFAQGWCFIGR